MVLRNSTVLKFMLKSGLFFSLCAIFYVYYFSEVVDKYADGYTNLAISKQTLDSPVKLPFMTLCMSPIAKSFVLNKYNMSSDALDEPTVKEKETFTNLNKMQKDLFMESTFQINKDFNLYITHYEYGDEGSKEYTSQLFEGNANQIQVCHTETI